MWVTPPSMPAVLEWTIPPPAPERRCTCRLQYTCPACLADARRRQGSALIDARVHAGQVRGDRIRTAALAALTDQPQSGRALVAALASHGVHVSAHALYHHLVTLASRRQAVGVPDGTKMLWVRWQEEAAP